MYARSKFFLRHSNETLVFPITVGKFFFNKCVPIGPCVPTGTFTLLLYISQNINIAGCNYYFTFLINIINNVKLIRIEKYN